jgi:hypothetical protein
VTINPLSRKSLTATRAATDKIKEPDTYVVLGEAQNVPTTICNCTAEPNEAEPKTVWVVTWKRLPSAAEKDRVLETLKKQPVATQTLTLPAEAGKGSNTSTVSELAAGSCLTAFGYSVQLIHADKSAGRHGRYKIQLPTKE